MGCENSKTVRVQPVGPPSDSKDPCSRSEVTTSMECSTQTPEAKHKQPKKRGSDSVSDNDSGAESDDHGNTKEKARKRPPPRTPDTKDSKSSCDATDEGTCPAGERGVSATSNTSTDSGLGDECSTRVASATGEGRESQKVEKLLKRRNNTDLKVTSGCKSPLSSPRLEEAQIMQSLREEGLISKPQVQATGGTCFKIVAATAKVTQERVPKPPPRLEKLAVERGQKKKRVLTEDEIRDKLEKAERRRKRREQERLNKIREMERKDAVTALDNFVQYQKSKEETIAQRMDQVHDNRERKLRELREKQERRNRHAEEVRKRKALAAESGTGDTACLQQDSSSLKMTPRPEMTLSSIMTSTQPTSSEQPEGNENPSSSENGSNSIIRVKS